MRITGDHVLQAPVEEVWAALLDPGVLVRTIPGCSRLEETGEHTYAMTVTAGVAAIKGTYAGTCALSHLVPHESLLMKVAGAGAPGTIGADVTVGFRDNGDGTTALTYAADAVVGGMIGGVGQRMLSSVSKRMAAEFFGNVQAAMAAPTVTAPAVNTPVRAGPLVEEATDVGHRVFTTADAGLASPASQQEFLRGVAVGAGLVLAGVIAGAVLGRSRG